MSANFEHTYNTDFRRVRFKGYKVAVLARIDLWSLSTLHDRIRLIIKYKAKQQKKTFDCGEL